MRVVLALSLLFLISGDINSNPEAMKAVGANVKFTTYEWVNLNSWENNIAIPDLLAWLFSYTK